MGDSDLRLRRAFNADYLLWLEKPEWSALEAPFLLGGFVPEELPEGSKTLDEAIEATQGIHEAIAEAIKAARLPVRNAPTAWVVWAEQRGLTLPPELIALAREQPNTPEQNDSPAFAGNAPPMNDGDSCAKIENKAKSKQENGEPFLQEKSRNSRAEVEKWVAWQAQKLVEKGDIVFDLADRIRLKAESHGYQSERGPLKVANITKMIPPGLTGGRTKSKGTKKKSSK